jgi:hypothetical protein
MAGTKKTPAERVADMLGTYLSHKQLLTLDVDEADLLSGVRTVVEKAKVAPGLQRPDGSS